MGLIRRLAAPFRRAWIFAIDHLHAKKRGRGVRKLYYDVQTCGYQDVHTMWSMLHHKSFHFDSPKRRFSSPSLLG